MIQAILFDLFETLVTEGMRQDGQSPTVAQRLGVDEQAFRTEWRKRQEKRMTGGFPDYASALTDTCAELNCGTDHSLIGQLESERIARFARLFADPDPGIMNALREIGQLDVKVGIVSNASADEIAAWRDCQLSKVTDIAVFSCEVGCMKPDQAIYLIACERLGVAPQECMYVGDGGFGELPAAAELGMITYCATWFRDRWPEDRPYPALTSPSGLVGAVRKAMERRQRPDRPGGAASCAT